MQLYSLICEGQEEIPAFFVCLNSSQCVRWKRRCDDMRSGS